MTKYHQKNDRRIRRNRRMKHRLMLDRIKMELGCQECGYCKDPIALQFHHINPEKKSFTISSYSDGPIMKILRETEKCIVLCANCHSILERNLNQDSLY